MNIIKWTGRIVVISCLPLAVAGSACGTTGTVTDKLAITTGPLPGAGNAITPALVSAHKGHNVEITVTNTGDKTHGFKVDGYNVSQTVDAGKTIVLRFKADHAGIFRVWCPLHPAHKDAHLTIP